MNFTYQSKGMPAFAASACFVTALLASFPARADSGQQLISLINDFRAAPGMCEGRRAHAAGFLSEHPALSQVRIGRGTILESALDKAGYPSRRAESIGVSGLSDPYDVMDLIAERYCRMLLRSEFSAVGVARRGDDWQIVLAQPMPALSLSEWDDAGKTILNAVNAARATPRICGQRRFAAAPALTWNSQLGAAALGHSREMARRKTLAHRGNDGSEVSDRAERARYRWERIGENIASGQATPDEAVSSWLASPGHCANIMNSGYTEMGAAYAVNGERRPGTVYWTQVLGRPR